MKILVVTPRYTISGVPLAQARFAAALAEAGHDVTFMVGRTNADLTIPALIGVRVIELDAANVRGMVVPLWRYLRSERPEVVFSAEDHLNCTVLAAAILSGSRAKISGSSRIPPFDTYSNRLFSKRWILKQVMRAVAWRADALTCVSSDMAKLYHELFPGMGHHCVHNIIVQPAALRRMAEPLDDPWFGGDMPPPIVAAGTLAPYKGFADLIRAMALLAEQGSTARLLILGEGPEQPALEQLIATLGLGDRVRLGGRVDNPLKYFARARVSALSSLAEGLPNVLVEAMMCGCTPVATDCRTGPAEVLQGGRYGYLATPGDPVSIAAALKQALDQPIAPELLAEAIKPFAQDEVIRRHFDLLGIRQG